MDKVASKLNKAAGLKSLASRQIKFEATNLARFADGSCTCSMGDTSVLVTSISKQPKQSGPSAFLPLTVDYRQKAAAAGRIPMTHLRRDFGVTEREILVSRMIDRSIRPGFAKGFNYDTQVVCNLLSVDGVHDSDILAINGASASLAISDIPWTGPIGAVRMGLVNDTIVTNPTRLEQEESQINLVMTSSYTGNLIMIDGSCKEPLTLPTVQKTIKQGLKECHNIIEAIEKLQAKFGKPKRAIDLSKSIPDEKYINFVKYIAEARIEKVLTNHKHDKTSRDDEMKDHFFKTQEMLKAEYPEFDMNLFNDVFTNLIRSTYRKILKTTQTRCDGRKFHQLRPISCKIDLHKPLHGSALFQRGQTQVLCSTTFDSPDAAYRADTISLLTSGVKEKNFMLHYNFPPYATNDIGRVGHAPDRREIGHGALAENGIRPVVPEINDMTIRLNCEVLESNGSSSMASVCAGSLSLMDASVNVKQHVAGVAIGLMLDADDELPNEEKSSMPSSLVEPIILTDILGFEDYFGDMDCKVAGTRRGITALMLDVKLLKGIPVQIFYKALQQAHTARGEIISIMENTIREPRKIKKDNHPVIKTIYIPPHKRGKFLGFGGSNLKKLVAKIGVRISAHSSNDVSDIDLDDTLSPKSDNFIIFAPNKEAMREAEEFIESLLKKEFKEPELQFNGVYSATIQEIRDNGVMITLYPNMTPVLLHLNQLDIKPVKHPSALDFKVGQEIQVKYFGRDPSNGQMRLSRKSIQMTSSARIIRHQ